MKIATFNINGIRARIKALPRWLEHEGADVDVVCLQEIKSTDEAFPRALFEDMGYQVETHGQKSFNGVAFLSRVPLEDVTRGLPGDDDDEQARWIEATVVDGPEAAGTAVRICALYLPNGNPAPGPKYDYKLAWMARMGERARELLADEEAAVMLGDCNVIPMPADAARPEAMEEDALFLPETRAAWRRMMNLGLTDAVHAHLGAGAHYTYWDYQRHAWERDNGMRIDHVLLTPQAADLLRDAGIDRQVRAGERPSDHVPVWVRLAA